MVLVSLFVGTFLFAFQIYCDFSGYSDIAIGTARLFGFRLMRNFAFPYFSRDIAEFWRRQQDAARNYHDPGKFVTFLGYEWSGGSDRGGDHNIYFLDDQHPLVYEGDLNQLFQRLAAAPKRSAFVIPHVGGRTGNWDFHDPRVQVAAAHTGLQPPEP